MIKIKFMTNMTNQPNNLSNNSIENFKHMTFIKTAYFNI